MSTEEKKAHLVLTADTKQYVAEVNAAAKADGAKADALKKQAATTSELGKKWEELSKSMVGLQLHDAFKRVSAGVSEATDGVLDLNMAFAGFKVAGPWGAAVGAVGVAAFKAAEQFSLMKGRLGDLVEEVEKKGGPGFTRLDGEIGRLTQTLYAQEAAILRQNAAWVELPRTLAYVFQSFTDMRKVLKDVDKDIQAYDASLRKTGLLMMVRGSEKAGGGARRSSGPSYDDTHTDLGSEIAGGIGNYDYLQSIQDRHDSALSSSIRASADLGGYGGSFDSLGQGVFGGMGIGGGAAAGAAGVAVTERQTFLEKTFGPVDQFDLYAQGFQMLSGAVGASLGAWIDGSASAGEAFKKFIGEALKGIAVQMAMEALKHGAYALGSLAFGDVRGAATHGKAAAGFAAGAVLAAGAAKAFHSGGGPSVGGASPGAPNVSGGGGGSATPERIIVYGDAFAEDSPRGKQRQAKRMIARATGNASVEVDS